VLIRGPVDRKAAAIDQGGAALNEPAFGCRFLDRQRDVQSAAEIDIPNLADALLGAVNRRNPRQMEEMRGAMFGDGLVDLVRGGDVEADRPEALTPAITSASAGNAWARAETR